MALDFGDDLDEPGTCKALRGGSREAASPGKHMEMAGRIENVVLPIDRMLHRIVHGAQFGPTITFKHWLPTDA
jgi:hypothetical protein